MMLPPWHYLVTGPSEPLYCPECGEEGDYCPDCERECVPKETS